MFLTRRGRRLGAEHEELEDGSSEFQLPAGISVQRDVAYGRHPAHRMDVYKQDGASTGPVIFLVHGGAWMTGDKASTRVIENKVAHWVPKGYLLVSINYRLLPEADPVAQADDVAAALSYVQSNVSSWGGDPARLIAIGHSSGAHLLALLSADGEMLSARGAQPWLGAVMLDSASMDVERTMTVPHRPLYDRVFGGSAAYWRSASPVHRLTRGTIAPVLMVCSSMRQDSCRQAQIYAEKVRSLQGRAEVISIPLSHSEINGELGLKGDYTAAVDSFIRSLGLP